MSKATLLRAADESMNSLLSWGIGGIILAVFVAPTFWLMVKTAQEREKKRSDRDEKDAVERSDRERKLIDALVQSPALRSAAGALEVEDSLGSNA